MTIPKKLRLLDNFEKETEGAILNGNGIWFRTTIAPPSINMTANFYQEPVNGRPSMKGHVINNAGRNFFFRTFIPALTYQNISGFIPGMSFKMKFTPLNLPGEHYYFMTGSYANPFATGYWHFRLSLDLYGDLYYSTGGGTKVLIAAGIFSNVVYEIRPYEVSVVLVNRTQFYVIVDGVVYDNAGAYYPLNNDVQGLDTIGFYPNADFFLEFYIDDLYIEYPNNGLSVAKFIDLGAIPITIPGGTLTPSQYTPPYENITNLVCITADQGGVTKIFKMDGRYDITNPANWSIIINGISPSLVNDRMCHFANGSNAATGDLRIYIFHYWTGSNYKVYSSLDGGFVFNVGNNFQALSTHAIFGVQSGKPSDGIGRACYVCGLNASPSTLIGVHNYNDISGNYGEWALPGTITWSTANGIPCELLLVKFTAPTTGTIWYIANFDGQTSARVYKMTVTGGVSTLVYTFPAGWLLECPAKYRVFCDNDDVRPVFYVVLINAGNYRTYRSVDLGVSWDLISTTPYKMINHSYYHWDYYGTTAQQGVPNGRLFFADLGVSLPKMYWFNRGSQTTIRITDPESTLWGSLLFRGMSTGGFVVTNTRILRYYPVPDEIFKGILITRDIMGIPTTAFLTVDPEYIESVTAEGRFVELYDGLNNLIFIGKIISPTGSNSKSRFEFDSVALDYEYNKKIIYDNRVTGIPQKQTTTNILKAIIPYQMAYVVIDVFSIPVTALSYYRKINDTFQNIISYVRALERAILFTEPSGRLQMYLYNAIPQSGDWFNEQHPQCNLVEFSNADMRLTRSEVAGGQNQAGQVRRVYIGDAALEAKEGITATQKTDSNIMDDPECLQMATNRFMMFGGAKWFIHLRIQNQGNIEAGKFIRFSWNDERVVIPFGNYLVVGWQSYDARNDVNDVYITDGIISQKEFMQALRSLNRDDDLTGTYYNANTQSTATAPILYQNPVNRLRAGCYVWRTPEPTTWDFYAQTALPNGNVPGIGVAGWRLFDLSTIVPEGARAVHIRVDFQDLPAGNYWLMRKPGQTNSFQCTGGYVQVNNTWALADIIVACSEDRRIDVYFSQAPNLFTNWNFIVLGWII